MSWPPSADDLATTITKLAWLASLDLRRGVKPFVEVPARRVEGWFTAILPRLC